MLVGLALSAGFGQTLHIRVLDYAVVPAAELAKFPSAAHDLFLAQGIDAEWRICRVAAEEGDCQPLRDLEPYVKIVGRSPAKEGPAVFGTTTRDHGVNRFAYVFWERVEDSARRHNVQASVLLAHVMAHEVGHLLGLDHSATGLMRRQFGPLDILSAIKGRLRFTSREGSQMRATLVQAVVAEER